MEESERVSEWDSVQDQVSFDIYSFHARLQSGDDWQRVVQGHLFLDHVATKMLEEALPHPEKIKIDRINFSAKVDLCAAMGLISAGREKMLKRVNRLRNSIAHDLHFKVTDRDAVELSEMGGEIFSLMIAHQRKGNPQFTLLCYTLKTLVVLFDSDRHQRKVGREQERLRQHRLREAVQNARGVLASMPEGESAEPEVRK